MANPIENIEKTQFTPEIQQQLNTIDQSMFFTRVILGGAILSYFAIAVQRQQIICNTKPEECCECLPDIFPIRMTSSIMIIIALFFFFCLAQKKVQQPCQDSVQCKSQNINSIASALVLVAALFRLFNLNLVENCSTTPQEQEHLIEEFMGVI